MRFLKNTLDERLIATSANFETVPIGDCYDRNGQEIDMEENGEYDVVAYNYHDGHNWKSIIINTDGGEFIEWEEIEGEEAEKLKKALEEKEFIKEERGIEYYSSGDYEITRSRFTTAWEDFEINTKNY